MHVGLAQVYSYTIQTYFTDVLFRPDLGTSNEMPSVVAHLIICAFAAVQLVVMHHVRGIYAMLCTWMMYVSFLHKLDILSAATSNISASGAG